MAMSDNPQYAHAAAVHHVKSKGLKQLKHKGNDLPEQMELLALSSDSCSTYPPERTSPSLSATVLSPTNNSVFNYNQQAIQQQPRQQRNIIYQANNQVHLHSQQQNGISPQIIQNPSMNIHVAQQLSPPHTLHPNQQMSNQLKHAVQQQRYQQPQLVQHSQQQQQQPIYNQSISPNSTIPSEPVEIIKVLSQALVGQHNQLQQQQQVANHQQHLFNLQQQQQAAQQQAAQQTTRPATQLNQMHHNDLLKRRLNRWERLTNQNRNYLLSLNNKEDQFRAICALSLLAVPEPQY